MVRAKQNPCVNRGRAFVPDRRNARHQPYCGAATCRAASRRDSQARWLAKNPEYHRGPEAVTRVRTWRQDHPGYRRGTRAPAAEAAPTPPLQDFLNAQPAVLIGLIAYIWGSR